MSPNIGSVSDGYHTFDDLYEHRICLWKALCRKMSEHHHQSDDLVWRSRVHSDGTSFPNWFVLGIGYEAGKQITYHLPECEWESCDFAKDLERAPEFDGHTPADVLRRIADL